MSKEYIFVDIGTANQPVPVVQQEKFGPGILYIGLDHNPDLLSEAHLEMQRIGEQKDCLIAADGVKIPLADDCADEVFLGNVLGSPFTKASPTEFLIETRRVLKKGGKLTVKETGTPENFPYKVLEQYHREYGFTNFIVYTYPSSDWDQIIAPYDGYHPYEAGSYIAFLSKSDGLK